MTEGYMIFRNVKPKKQLVLLQILRDSGYHGLCDDYETKKYLPFDNKVDIVIRDKEVTWFSKDDGIAISLGLTSPLGIELDLDIELTINYERYTKDILKILNKQGILWASGSKPSEFNPSKYTMFPLKLYTKDGWLEYGN